MIRAIVWKEIREQGLIALTLVVLGGGVLVAAAMLAEPPVTTASPTDVIKFLGLGQLATLMLAVTAGMVCGGAVFAAEREAGTFHFLDSLPTTRLQLWQAKLFAGLGLAVVQVALLIAIAAALGLVPSRERAIAIALYSLLAFVWGMLGSTSARTTLGSVGVAIPASSLTALLILLPVMIVFQQPGSGLPRMMGLMLFVVGMFAIPLVLSAWLFTSLDRTRAADEIPTRQPLIPRAGLAEANGEQATAPARPHGARHPRFGLLALVWLSTQQLLVTAPVLSAFALLFGLALLVPTAKPFVMWPALALTTGVIAGVMAFADEQTRGSARYWGEQRLPIGRVWLFKIGVHLLLCAWLLLLLAIPIMVRSQLEDPGRISRTHSFLAGAFRSPLFDELGSQAWKFLLVPAVYGFAAGHLCGLLFKKLVVACGVAGIVGGVAAMMWGPSLLSGGVKHWQLWLPPLAALLTGFLLIRAWVAERIATRSAITTLTCGCLATIAILAAGIGYRILEIPERTNGEDDLALVAGLTPFDDNIGGRDFKAAAEKFNRLSTAHSPTLERMEKKSFGPQHDRIDERLDRVLRLGWMENDHQLAGWLNSMFAESPAGMEDPSWHATARSAAELPIGIFEYPQLITLVGSTAVPLDHARRMAIALLVRGLQRQAAGDPNDFAGRFRTCVKLAQTLRNGSVVAGFIAGAEVERAALLALDRWMDQLPARSDRFRMALELVAGIDSLAPFDPTPYFLAERHVLREGMRSPSQWLPHLLSISGDEPEANATEVDLVGLAWAVPWEEERTRRLIGMGFESGLPPNSYVVLGRPGLGLLIGRARVPQDLSDVEAILATHRRAAILKVALRAFRAEQDHFPDSLSELVKGGYLRSLPTDPFDPSRSFGYRVSKAPGDLLITSPRLSIDRVESVEVRPGSQTEPLRVPIGQPILWAVGPDKIDHGGKNLPVGLILSPARPPDLVYLVPIGLSKPASRP